MTLPEQINKKEREIHAIKGNLKALKSNRWINENYADGEKTKELNRKIKANEKQLETERKQLFKLLSQFYKN
jgi:septal ring factor EnvC (AmiA/AmiB activator)